LTLSLLESSKYIGQKEATGVHTKNIESTIENGKKYNPDAIIRILENRWE
jgi:hypothetical protein